MKDIEKIKQALICQKNIVGKLINCGDCAYRDSRDCLIDVTDDVINLLEKKEPAKPMVEIYYMNGKRWTKAQAVRKGIEQCLMKSSREEYETQCADCPFYDPDVTVEECKESLQSMALDLLYEYEERIAIMTEGRPEG